MLFGVSAESEGVSGLDAEGATGHIVDMDERDVKSTPPRNRQRSSPRARTNTNGDGTGSFDLDEFLLHQRVALAQQQDHQQDSARNSSTSAGSSERSSSAAAARTGSHYGRGFVRPRIAPESFVALKALQDATFPSHSETTSASSSAKRITTCTVSEDYLYNLEQLALIGLSNVLLTNPNGGYESSNSNIGGMDRSAPAVAPPKGMAGSAGCRRCIELRAAAVSDCTAGAYSADLSPQRVDRQVGNVWSIACAVHAPAPVPGTLLGSNALGPLVLPNEEGQHTNPHHDIQALKDQNKALEQQIKELLARSEHSNNSS